MLYYYINLLYNFKPAVFYVSFDLILIRYILKGYIIQYLIIMVNLVFREIMKLLPTKVNLMLVLALIFSIICFFLMDFFVSEEETVDTHISCSIVS